MHTGRKRRGLSLLTAALALTATSPWMAAPARAATADPSICNQGGAAPALYSHVVVIMDENLSYSTYLKSTTEMPYLKSLGAACGSESNMVGATHPSVNNYLAATSGQLSADKTLTVYKTSENIFHQMQAVGQTWANYAESEPTPCQGTQVDPYKVGHVPAWYYNDIHKTTCPTNQVPLTQMNVNALPTFTWITPNECHDTYYVSVCTTLYGTGPADRFRLGDDWLSTMIPTITATADYQAGKTLILVTFDEGDKTQPHYIDCSDPSVAAVASNYCTIPTIAVAPTIPANSVDSTFHSLFTLLGTTEDVLGVPRINRAVTAGTLRGLGF
jgi:phosphatidylinositol-3-phosphatase